MYGEDDLDAAVVAGVLSAESVDALRQFVAGQRATPAVDEENIRLVTSFNDIFVSIALNLILFSVYSLMSGLGDGVASATVAVVSWGLAEYFTRRRRMALPSILLTLGVVGGAAGCGLQVVLSIDQSSGLSAMIIAGLFGGLAAYAHWRRFRVPVVVAAGNLAFLAIFLTFALWGLKTLSGDSLAQADILLGLIFFGGVLTFAHAMWWDMSDRHRRTRRSDVAFWLHLASAPMIVHPAFSVVGGLGTGGDAVMWIAVGLYALLALLALIVDRRAMLVPALGYVLYSITVALKSGSATPDAFTVTALVVGSALLMLSVIWHPARRWLVNTLPLRLRNRLPVLAG